MYAMMTIFQDKSMSVADGAFGDQPSFAFTAAVSASAVMPKWG